MNRDFEQIRRQFASSKTTVAEAIRLDHRYGLIVELRTPHLHECPVIFHLCFQAAITRWRYPLVGFLGDGSSLHLKNCHATHRVDGCTTT